MSTEAIERCINAWIGSELVKADARAELAELKAGGASEIVEEVAAPAPQAAEAVYDSRGGAPYPFLSGMRAAPQVPLCSFNQHAPAVARFTLEKGCIGRRNDHEQFLCMQHLVTAEPIGEMELVEILPAGESWRDDILRRFGHDTRDSLEGYRRWQASALVTQKYVAELAELKAGGVSEHPVKRLLQGTMAGHMSALRLVWSKWQTLDQVEFTKWLSNELATPAPQVPLQQVGTAGCQSCGGPHQFDTSVPSQQWNEVIRASGLPEHLCLTCIVREFVSVGKDVTAELWGGKFNGERIEIRLAELKAGEVSDAD